MKFITSQFRRNYHPYLYGLVLSLMVLLLCCQTPTEESPVTELRGVWVTNVASDVLDSRESIEEAVTFLSDHHFNVIYPVVWNDAFTLYPSAVMDSLFGIKIDPRFAGRDPLAELIEVAHRYNMAVVPWFEYGFAASYHKSGGSLIEKFPHWAARDEEGALLTKNGFEWMNGFHPEVQEFILALIREVVENYAVDGIQGDDRLPAQPSEGGYSEYTRSLYQEETGNTPPANAKDTTWLRWRADRLTEFAGKVYKTVKEADPDICVTWSPSIFPWSTQEYLQDWPEWMRQGYSEFVHPQNYRYSFERYKTTVDILHPDTLDIPAALMEQIYPGILMQVDNYLISPEYLLEAVAYNRAKGFQGEVYFFYEGLRANDGLLADTLLATWYREPALLPRPFRSK